jgi:hypothetical protein
MSTDCIKTTVVNTSGVTRRFSFLPPYGVELAPNATFTHIGTIYDWIDRGRRKMGHTISMRDVEYALSQNWLAIQSTPATIVHDSMLASSHMLVVDNGSFKIQSPCYVTPVTSTVIGP